MLIESEEVKNKIREICGIKSKCSGRRYEKVQLERENEEPNASYIKEIGKKTMQIVLVQFDQQCIKK